MFWLRANGRVLLSHLAVTCRDGQEVCIPWCELRGPDERLRPSPLARYLWPNLPSSVRTSPSVGRETIRKLRVRAVCIELAEAKLDRFWLVRPACNFARIALLVFAGTFLVHLIAFWSLNGFLADHVQFREFSPRAQMTDFNRETLGIVLLFGVGAPVLLLSVHLATRLKAKPLAMRATTRGIEVHFDDAHSMFLGWPDVLDSVLRPRFRFFLRKHNIPTPIERDMTEWHILLAAVSKRLEPRKPRRSRTQELRAAARAWMVFVTLFMMSFAAAAALSQLDPGAELARGQRSPESGDLLIGGLVLFLFSVVFPIGLAMQHLGCKRYRLRLAQAFGWRSRRHR